MRTEFEVFNEETAKSGRSRVSPHFVIDRATVCSIGLLQNFEKSGHLRHLRHLRSTLYTRRPRLPRRAPTVPGANVIGPEALHARPPEVAQESTHRLFTGSLRARGYGASRAVAASGRRFVVCGAAWGGAPPSRVPPGAEHRSFAITKIYETQKAHKINLFISATGCVRFSLWA